MSVSTNSDNITNWKALSDIDYFTQFIKSYLAFNAWMRTRYTTIKTDRMIIETVKHENNEFKRKIKDLYSRTDADGEVFRSYVSFLHYHFERVEVKNNGKKISFYDVFIEENLESKKESMRNRLLYKVEIFTNNKVKVSVHDNHGNEKYMYEQVRYDLLDLLNKEDYQKLSQNQKMEIKYLYSLCNPKKTENVISSNTTGLKIGQYYFVNDVELLSKALIEILYSLRCSLFHGEVLPGKDTNKVYEYAYHILKMLIQVL